MTADHLTLLVGIFGTLLASSGFWLFVMRRLEVRSGSQKLLIGLAHNSITQLSMHYIRRGYITHDEHENLFMFLYEPYKEVGGNGTAKRLIDVVNSLPIVTDAQHYSSLKGDIENAVVR